MCRRRGGFTLIELLVVVAVMSILASLLMPAMLKATRSATTTHCKSNIRQIATAVQLYRQSIGLMFLPWGQARWPGDTGGHVSDRIHQLLPSGTLDHYFDKKSGVWVCPADRRARTRGANWWYVSYTFNSYLDYIPDSDIDRPTQIITFMCGFEDSGWIEFPGTPWKQDDSPYTTNRAEYKRHGGRFAATYYDAHVEMLYPLETSHDDFYPH